MWVALALTVAVTALASGRLDGASAGDQVVAPERPTPGERSGQIEVTGTLTSLRLHGAALDPRSMPTPLTITSERGFGNGATLTRVGVDGTESSIVWDGGRPFVLAGDGGLIADPVVVDLVPEGLRFLLGGSTHRLVPGGYQLDTPVAIGTSGVATPRDSVAFTATDDTRLEGRGDAALVVGLSQPQRLRGPGRVEIEGALELTDATGVRSTSALVMDLAAFDLTVKDDGNGTISIRGIVSSSPLP